MPNYCLYNCPQSLVDGVEGCCDMHLASLMAALALSLVERKVDNKVVNYWAPFQDLYKQVKTCVKYVCDKKNKRFGDYQQKLLSLKQQDVRMIPLPATTRISGALLLIQSFLRSMHALAYYATRTDGFASKWLTPGQCHQLAQFEAIMRKAHMLGFEVQTDRPEVAAELPLLLTLLINHYNDDTEFEVVDTSKDWPATTLFEDLPRMKMTTDSTKATAEMPLMSKHSLELIEKYKESYDEYFGEGKVNPDRLLAQITHPFLGTTGFDELKLLRSDDGESLYIKAQEVLKEEIIKRSNAKPTSVSTETVQMEDDEDEDVGMSKIEKLARMRKNKARKQLAKKSSTSSDASVVEELAEQAVKEFGDSYFDPETELKDQLKRMGKSEDGIDWERVQNNDTLYISSIFDSLEWWKAVGRNKYPLVHRVVLAILPLPASNAFLERIFSTCTRFDDPLRNALRAKRFEIAVLLAVNEALLDDSGAVPTDDEAQNIVDKVISMFDKPGSGFSASIDLGIDRDDDDFQAKSDDEANDE